MARFLIQWLMMSIIALVWVVPGHAQNSSEEVPQRIVAVGDLHGDFGAWQEIARASGITDDKGDWSGNTAFLVQLGDISDRGPQSLKIIKHLQKLQRQAEKAGGKVIVLLGNHEAMNVIGDLRYVHPGEIEAFVDRKSKRRRDAAWEANRDRVVAAYAALDPPIGADEAKQRWFEAVPLGQIEHQAAWGAGGKLGKWAADLPAVVKLGQTLFVHGGFSAEASENPIDVINAQVRAALLSGDKAQWAALEAPLGPLWYRGNIVRDEAEVGRLSRQEELALVLTRYGARRLVVAHTPSLEGIIVNEDGTLIRIDSGNSSYYGGPLSYLELAGDTVTAHQRSADGNWTSRQIQDGSNEDASQETNQ